MQTLTAIEREVLAGVAGGETVEQTAARVHRAVGTVKHHRRHVLSKLGASNAAHAVALAYRYGVLGEEPAAINDRQVVAFQARTSILAKRRGVSRERVRREALARVVERSGRDLDHYQEMTALEASWILDELDDELGDA